MDNAKAPLQGQKELNGGGNTCEGQILGSGLGADDLKAKSMGGILYSDRHEEVRKSGRHRWSLGKRS